MTLFHFINCMGVASAPYFVVYRYSGLSEYNAFYRCLKAGAGYLTTQLVKVMLMATLFPTDSLEDRGVQGLLITEAVRCTLNTLDLLGLYTVLTRFLGRGEMKILATVVGWGSADVITSKLLPVWVGARGAEFEWVSFQRCLGANIDLILLLGTCGLLWLWSRKDLSKTFMPLVAALLATVCYRTLLFQAAVHFLGLDTWVVLVAKFVFACILGLVTLQLHTAMVVAKRSS